MKDNWIINIKNTYILPANIAIWMISMPLAYSYKTIRSFYIL